MAIPVRGERGITLVELAITIGLFGMIMVGVMGAWQRTQEAYFIGSDQAEAQQNVRAAIDFMVRELRATGRDITICAFDYAGAASLDCAAAKVNRCTATLAPSTYGNANGQGGQGCVNVFAIPFGNATATTVLIRADRNDNGTIAGLGNAGPSDPGEENVLYAYTTSSPPCPAGVPACITRDDGTGPVAMVAVNIAGLALSYFPRSGFPPCDGVPPPYPCPAFTLPFTTQQQADNIARLQIQVQAVSVVAGQTVSRTLVTDVALKNRL